MNLVRKPGRKNLRGMGLSSGDCRPQLRGRPGGRAAAGKRRPGKHSAENVGRWAHFTTILYYIILQKIINFLLSFINFWFSQSKRSLKFCSSSYRLVFWRTGAGRQGRVVSVVVCSVDSQRSRARQQLPPTTARHSGSNTGTGFTKNGIPSRKAVTPSLISCYDANVFRTFLNIGFSKRQFFMLILSEKLDRF